MNSFTSVERPTARRAAGNGFAVQELAVVIGAIALIAAIGIPSMTSIQQNAWDAVCLNNLRQIGRAAHQYANDDRFEQLVPLGMPAVLVEPSFRFFDGYSWKYAERIAYGGRTPVAPWKLGGGDFLYELMAVEDGGSGFWTAEQRPLNQYLDAGPDPEPSALNVFHCPVDTGPPYWEGQQAFDIWGNSYEGILKGVFINGWPEELTTVYTGAIGHRASSIASPPAETLLLGEPYFTAHAGEGGLWEAQDFWGWHRRFRTDNALYIDGSARFTRVDPGVVLSQEELEAMGVTHQVDWYALLLRGPTYQVDCYPTPGAKIRRVRLDGALSREYFDQIGYDGWPFDNCQNNRPPE